MPELTLSPPVRDSEFGYRFRGTASVCKVVPDCDWFLCVREGIRARIFKPTFMEPKNWFQGTNSARLCRLAGRYDDPIPVRFLAPIDCFKIPAQLTGALYAWHIPHLRPRGTWRRRQTGLRSACQVAPFPGSRACLKKTQINYEFPWEAFKKVPSGQIRWLRAVPLQISSLLGHQSLDVLKC